MRPSTMFMRATDSTSFRLAPRRKQDAGLKVWTRKYVWRTHINKPEADSGSPRAGGGPTRTDAEVSELAREGGEGGAGAAPAFRCFCEDMAIVS